MELSAAILFIIAITTLAAAFPVGMQDWAEEDVFYQKLDHFNPDNKEYFKQRYFKLDFNYHDGAPIFLEIGGEGPQNGIGPSIAYETARKVNGMMLALEHRYYGKSVPESYSGGIPRYLSSEQALEDIAYFIQAQKELYPHSPWIVSGCSYPGNLATWMRLKYPHLVNGAIAGSAPVLAKVDFYEYAEVVGEVVKERDPVCHQKLVEANEEFTTLVKTDDGQKKLAGMFGYPHYDSTLGDNLHKYLFDVFSMTNGKPIQNLNYSESYTSWTCNRITSNTDGKSTLEILINLSTFHGTPDSLESTLRQLLNTRYVPRTLMDDYMWFYQMCNEFGYFQTLSSKKHPFGFWSNVNEWAVGVCKKYNIDLETVEDNVRKTNLRYGGKTPNVTNVVFVHGSNDPWHPLGVLSDLSSSARVFMFQGLSHCEYDQGRGHFTVEDERIPEWMKIYDEIESIVRSWF